MTRRFVLTVITSLTTCVLVAQNTVPSGAERRRMHADAEITDDPYLPNAYNNTRVTPAYRYNNRAQAKTAGGTTTVFTTQVNVDVAGMNITADAANEPSIAVNPLNHNQMAIGWRQFDNVLSNFRQAGWAYTNDGGLTWTFDALIEPGIFRSDPVLAADDAGNFYYNSLTNTPDFFCKVFISADGGVSWDAGTDAAGGDKQWMTIDRTQGPGNGNIYATWTSDYSTCLPDNFTRSTNGGTSYENCTLVEGTPFWMKLATGPNGELYVGGAGEFDSLVVSKSNNALTAGSTILWEPPVSVFMDGYINGWQPINPEGIMGMVNIEVDKSTGPNQGTVYLLAAMTRLNTSDPGDIMFVRSTDGGLTWSAPVAINDDGVTNHTQWFGTMSVAPTGRIDVVWLDTRDAPVATDNSALYYSYSLDGGLTWSPNEMLSNTFDQHVGYPMQNKMGDYFDMVSDSTGADLAWAATFNGEEDVYYSRIEPPLGTGIGEHTLPAFTVTPNPSNGIVVIQTTAAKFDVEIFAAPGNKIQELKNVKPGSQLNLSQQAAGIYLVKVILPDGSASVKKMILQ